MPARTSLPFAALIALGLALLTDRVWIGVQNENAHVRIAVLESQMERLEARVRELEKGRAQ